LAFGYLSKWINGVRAELIAIFIRNDGLYAAVFELTKAGFCYYIDNLANYEVYLVL